MGLLRPPITEAVTYVDAHRSKSTGGLTWGVEPICEQRQVAPSTYYAAKSRSLSKRSLKDSELGPQRKEIWQTNYSVYGRRKLHKATARKGIYVGRDQVERLMKRQEIVGAARARKRFTTQADETVMRAPDLVNRNFSATRPNQLWVCDFTYCSTWSGMVYVSFVTDVFGRKIVGWKTSRSMTSSLVIDALNVAAWTRRHISIKQLRCHSDAGSQYVSVTYTERLEEIEAKLSIGTVGDSFDNARGECMFALFKTEPFRNPAVLSANGGPRKGLNDLELAISKWVYWFNEVRKDTELGDLSPSEFEANDDVENQATAA